MDLPSNPNFCENHGNTNTGIPEQNVHVNNLTLTTAQIELMRQQPVYSDPLLQGGNSESNNSINLISGKQDLPGTNQTSTAVETEQIRPRQPADISSADPSERNHHPVNNQSTAAETVPMRRQQQLQLPDISSADSPAVHPDRKRKREADQRYKAKQKKEREEMKLKVTTLEAENEQLEAETKSLKEQLDIANKALDKLGKDFVDMKKKYEKEHESKQALEDENRGLKDKYIELLEKSNPLVDPRFGTQSKESGRQYGQTTNLSSERDFGSSGIDSITQ